MHVDPSNVKQVLKSNRYFSCSAFGSFNTHDDPSGRGHMKSWKSAHAWCTIDLKRQRIAHRWIQKCKQCEGESEPWFDKRTLEKMAKRAVKLYLINIGRLKKEKKADDDDDDNDQLIGPPHDEARCAMCQKLGRSCWKKYTKKFNAEVDQDENDEDWWYDGYDQDENEPESDDDDYADEDYQYEDRYNSYDDDDYYPYQYHDDYEDTYDYDDTNDDYPYDD